MSSVYCVRCSAVICVCVRWFFFRCAFSPVGMCTLLHICGQLLNCNGSNSNAVIAFQQHRIYTHSILFHRAKAQSQGNFHFMSPSWRPYHFLYTHTDFEFERNIRSQCLWIVKGIRACIFVCALHSYGRDECCLSLDTVFFLCFYFFSFSSASHWYVVFVCAVC